MQISIGCGRTKKEGFVGLDIQDFGWNKVWDAKKDKLPFPDGSVSFIEAHNFFEHVERKYWRDLFNECWRVLKSNGVMELTVPNAEKAFALAIQDITHVSFWCKGTFKYLTGERPRNADYGFKHWIILRLEDDPKDPEGRVIFAQLSPSK
jgi:predicted SAM-dependent methyltransferase